MFNVDCLPTYSIKISIDMFSLFCSDGDNFCLIEVKAMVVAVQQLLVEWATIFTVCICRTPPPLCALTIRTTCTDQKCNGCHGSAEINANVLAKYIKHNMENFEHSQQWKKHFGITDVHLWTVVHVLIIEELTCLSGLTLGVTGCHWVSLAG